jgi:hypothetical protein
MMKYRSLNLSWGIRALPLAALVLILSGCGSLDGSAASAAAAASQASSAGSVQSFSITVSQELSTDPSSQQALPLFHIAPVVLAEPADTDVVDSTASASSAPHLETVSAELSQLSTKRLTRAAIDSVLRDGIVPTEVAGDTAGATPLTAGTAVATYTPAQIRAAYYLPALPAVGASLSSLQAAQLAAGQTIYLIDAQDDPNSAAELATFDQKFGLPGCTLSSIAPNAALPLPAAATGGCTFAVVHSTPSGTMTAAAPAYDSGWATEIALDVQWAHATAPLARIILIEAPDSSLGSLVAAVSLANAMGPGVVSMSFGSPEGSWTASVDSNFTASNMSYVAGAGDSGAAVNWPAVSAHVLAVGGSTLTYSGSAARSEVVWSGTGGGVSQYTPTPSYQTSAVPDMGAPAKRSVSDVTFNADPSSGQYIAVLSPGATTANWLSAGGTSLATPQWAGIIAIANALRAQARQAPLGQPHARIYGIAAQGASYASGFYDITHGSDGSCALCYAQIGYDQPSGIGTPNVTTVLSALDAAPAAIAPVVAAASVSGTAGTPLSFNVSVSASDPVTYSLANAPSGMSVASSGVVSWASPTLGTFAVSVNARDNVNGLSGQGIYTVTIHPAQPPVVAGASLSGTAGTALLYTVAVSDSNPVSFSLSGAPSGMTISAAGVLSWPSPVAGNYSVTVSAHDTRTALTGQGMVGISIAAPKPPSVAAATISATVGVPLSFTVAVTATDPVTFSLTGAPAGMTISGTGVIAWSNPVAGSYAITVSAKDTKTGLSGSAVCIVTVSPAGPVITASALTGTAGKALSGTISVTDKTSSSLSISISGIPPGMTFLPNGSTLAVSWPVPVTGSYHLGVTAKDGSGRTASVTVPVTITAH